MHELVVTLFLADVRLLAKLMQVVSGGKEVTLPSGVAYTDVKIGGGSPVQKGYLVILDFKYTYCNPVQPVMPSWLSSAFAKQALTNLTLSQSRQLQLVLHLHFTVHRTLPAWAGV